MSDDAGRPSSKCDECGEVRSTLCAGCLSNQAHAAAERDDRDMRAFRDEIATATFVGDLVGPISPA